MKASFADRMKAARMRGYRDGKARKQAPDCPYASRDYKGSWLDGFDDAWLENAAQDYAAEVAAGKVAAKKAPRKPPAKRTSQPRIRDGESYFERRMREIRAEQTGSYP